MREKLVIYLIEVIHKNNFLIHKFVTLLFCSFV